MSKPGPYYILYKDFMKNIDDLKMDYEKEANKKYWMLLEDFMLTISSLEGNMKMDTELKEFLAHNQDNVEKLLKRINEAKKYNKQIAQNVRARINFDENRYTQWIWNDANLLAAVLVHDLLEVDAKIAIDTTFNLDEQSIFLFVRNPRNKTIKDNYQLKDWLIKKGIKDQDITYRQDKDILQYKNKFNNTNDLASNLNELLSLLK